MPKHHDPASIPPDSLEVLEAVLLERPREIRHGRRRQSPERAERRGCALSNTWLVLKSTLMLPRARRARIEAMVHPESVRDIRRARWLGLEVAVIDVQGLGCQVVAVGRGAHDYADRVSLRIGSRCLCEAGRKPYPTPLPLPPG